MNVGVRTVLLCCSALLMAACSPARTGVIDGALTTNLRPGVSIKATAPFTLADSGRVWSALSGGEMGTPCSASFDYALYTDPAVFPAARFAYAAIIRLEDKENWSFVPQGHKLPGLFGSRKKVEPAGLEGSVYSFHVASAGDWASDMLAANGLKTPEAWLAKRWIFSLTNDARAMAEYREPWPDGLEIPESEVMLLHDAQAEFLRAFERRALAAFSFGGERGEFSGAPKAKPSWNVPESLPDVEKLVGEVLRRQDGRDTADYD